MAVVEQLDDAINQAQRQGIDVRIEYLEEIPGGLCRVGYNVRIYLDLASPPAEQLELLTQALATLAGEQAPTAKGDEQSRSAA